MFNQVLDRPGAYGITAGLRNLTEFCLPYNKSPDPQLFDPACGVARNEYFWVDDLHVSSTVHELLAEQIVDVALREEM